MQKNAKQARRKPAGRRKAGGSAPWHLYVIECEDGSLYTGIAIDAHLRYAAHMTGAGARYTRSHPPKRMLLCLGYADRSAAAQAEYALKQLPAAQKRTLVRNHGGPA
jgi:putative endonuclease